MGRGFSPRRAAEVLHVHRNTIYSWCMRAVNGEPSRLRHVDRHPITGYLSIPETEIARLQHPDDDDDSK